MPKRKTSTGKQARDSSKFPVYIDRPLPTFRELLDRVMRLRDTSNITVKAANAELKEVGIEAARMYVRHREHGYAGFNYPIQPQLSGNVIHDREIWSLTWRSILTAYGGDTGGVYKKESAKGDLVTVSYPPDRWQARCEGYIHVLAHLIKLAGDSSRADSGDRYPIQAAKLDLPKPCEKPGEQGTEPARQKTWQPPPGFEGRKSVCTHQRFRKDGKNPPATTIDVWVKAAERAGRTVTHVRDPLSEERADDPVGRLEHRELLIFHAPDSGECFYPERWIMDRIRTWNPRHPKT